MNDTPGKPAPVTGSTLDEKVKNARAQLDEHVRTVVLTERQRSACCAAPEQTDDAARAVASMVQVRSHA